jgi:hypothetical protein
MQIHHRIPPQNVAVHPLHRQSSIPASPSLSPHLLLVKASHLLFVDTPPTPSERAGEIEFRRALAFSRSAERTLRDAHRWIILAASGLRVSLFRSELSFAHQPAVLKLFQSQFVASGELKRYGSWTALVTGLITGDHRWPFSGLTGR